VNTPPLDPNQTIADHLCEIHRTQGEEAAEAYRASLDDETQKRVFLCLCEGLSPADQAELFAEMKRMARENETAI
jgi:hypothetical protein